MGMGLLQLPDDLEKRRQQWLWDDFFAYVDTQTWTKVTSGSGTVAINSGSGNATQMLLSSVSSGGEAAVTSTNAFWQFLANKPLMFECRINAQEANTNNLAIFAGFSSTFASGLVSNANPGVFTASLSCAGFFLNAGSTNWSVVQSIGSAQTISATAEAAVPSVDQILRIEVKPVGSNVEVDYLVGNADTTGGGDSAFPVGFQQARETASGYLKPIKHRFAVASAAQMKIGVYIRGMSSTSETCRVDYIGGLSLR